MKKMLIAFGSVVLAALLFIGGVYASEKGWLYFTGEEEITQADNNVDEIMKILRKTFTDKELAESDLVLAESELAKIEAELEGVINDGSPGLVKQIKKLKEDKAKLEGDIEDLRAELTIANTNLVAEKDKLSAANGTIGDLQDDIKDLNGELSETGKYVTHLEDELIKANNAVNEHSQSVQKAVEEARTYKDTDGE